MTLVSRMESKARKQALLEAADIVSAEARWQWDRDEFGFPGAQIVAQRMQIIEATIRRRAELEEI